MNKNNLNSPESKHIKYLKQYEQNEIYWGIGIENELYLEFDKKINITKNFLFNNHTRERYSINYFDNYKKGILKQNLMKLYSFNKNNNISLPLLFNSHNFLNTDSQNNPRTLYNKLKITNPLFKGTTLLEDLLNNEYFLKTYNTEWLIDGDTIEFVTINYYKNKLMNILHELKFFKYKFINNLNKYFKNNNIFTEYGKLNFMKSNYPISVHLTNLDNISIFNNGTLHYNITLPTYLNNDTKIDNFDEFVKVHKDAIKIIQWFEPFMISVYNTIDYFNNIDDKCSNCSQRCAISRYIGVGTFDTDEMIRGKILQISTNKFKDNLNWWYHKYHLDSSYKPLHVIGLDINFNKHYNHGIEIRLFDHILEEEYIYESFEFIILLMDFILENPNLVLPNPIYHDIWNNIVYNCMKHGINYKINIEELNLYKNLFTFFNIDNEKEYNIKEIYYQIYYNLLKKYTIVHKDHFPFINKDELTNKNSKYILKYIGPFSKLSIDKKIITKTFYNKLFNINEQDIDNNTEIIIDIQPNIQFNNNILAFI
jgi:hypothetical protein